MKPYPKYKSSGVPWLGDVPEHWEIVRLKHKARFVGGGTPSKEQDEYWEGPIPWVSPKDMKSWRIKQTEDCISEKALAESACALIDKGAVLIVVRSGILQHSIPVALNDVPVAVNQDMKALLPIGEVSPAFIAYYIAGNQKALLDEWVKQGSTVESIEFERMARTPLVVPDPSEQQALVAYLDTETARIDTLVAEKETLIGLLSEARMSTITRLIAGADLPGVPSGNPWVPHLPRGWQLKRLKHLADVRSGLAKGKDYGGKPTVKMPYLRVANVQDGHLNLTEVLTIEVAADEAERFLLQSGDVLMNEGGDYDKLGRGAVWSGEVTPCLHQNHVFAVRPYEEDVSEWLAVTTQTGNAKFYFKSNAKQSTNLASINQTNVKELPVLLPPPKERQQLLSQLRTEVLKIDGLISHVEKEIELLKELRSATITDAVLGRIDLRDHTKKNKQDKAIELQPAL